MSDKKPEEKKPDAAKKPEPKKVEDKKPKDKEPDLPKEDSVECCQISCQTIADRLSALIAAGKAKGNVDKAIVHLIDAKACLDAEPLF